MASSTTPPVLSLEYHDNVGVFHYTDDTQGILASGTITPYLGHGGAASYALEGRITRYDADAITTILNSMPANLFPLAYSVWNIEAVHIEPFDLEKGTC